jgi:hypothetical protein
MMSGTRVNETWVRGLRMKPELASHSSSPLLVQSTDSSRESNLPINESSRQLVASQSISPQHERGRLIGQLAQDAQRKLGSVWMLIKIDKMEDSWYYAT